MAKTDKRKLGSPGGGKSGGKPPISSHPVFPAIVALWFAALFGIGSIVLPNILIEKFVVAIGLPSLFAAATPPLGITAKLMIATTAAVLGAVAGVFIARKIVAAQAQAPTRNRREIGSRDEGMAKRPIVATEELGEEGLGPVSDEDDWSDNTGSFGRGPRLGGRRRALSVTDDSGPSEYLAAVPLPGEDPDQAEEDDSDILDMSEYEAAESAEASDAVADAEAHAEDHANAMVGAVVGNRPFDVPAHLPSDDEQDDSAKLDTVGDNGARQPLQLGMPDEDNAMNHEPASNGDHYNPFAAQASQPPAEEAPRQVFGQPQPAAHPAQEAAPAALQFPPQSAPQFATPVAATQAIPHPVPSEPASFAAPVASAPSAAPLAELSMSELIERFARSMQVTSEANRAVSADDSSEPVSASASAPFAYETQGEDNAPVAAPVPFTFQRGSAAAPAPFAPAAVAEPAGQASVEPGPAEEFPQHIEAEAPAAAFDTPSDTASNLDAAPAETVNFASPAPAFAAPTAVAENARPTVPAALRPLDLGAFEEDEDEDEDDPFAGGLGLNLNGANSGSANPFAAPAQASFQTPSHPDEANDESDTGNNDGYSSLLSMKSPLGANREFVRVEDDEESDEGRPPEPVVTFPGQGEGMTASSAANAARPFDAPPHGGQRTPGLAPAVPTNPALKQADPVETEKALREALEKLQRMSGAA